MLLAYIDEIGETGAFVSKQHPRFNTSPAFGYAGFILPADKARRFGEIFTIEKRRLFKSEIENATNPGRWERKGSDIFRPRTHESYPQQLRVFDSLVRAVRELDGWLFYYADEKPLGTDRQTRLDQEAREVRETYAMREALNRIARHADGRRSNVMVVIDQINESTRAARIPNMYGHILSRATEHPEMKRIIEPPMHVDSYLSANIQFADWVASCVSKAIEYQTIRDSPFRWVCDPKHIKSTRGVFTHESKLHLWDKSVEDLNHSNVFRLDRRLFPEGVVGPTIQDRLDPHMLAKIYSAAQRSAARSRSAQRDS